MSTDVLVSMRFSLFNVPSHLQQADEPTPLTNLPSVHVRAEPRELLWEVCDRAMLLLRRDHTVSVDLVRFGYFLALVPKSTSECDPQPWRSLMCDSWYVVDAGGRLYVDDEHLRQVTIADWYRAANAGYLPGTWDDIVLVEPEGLGASEYLEPLWHIISDLGVPTAVAGYSATRAKRWLKRKSGDRKAKAIAQEWHSRGINSPYHLRAWTDLKPQWSVREVADRLSLDAGEAEELLIQLGYDFHPGEQAWIIGTTPQAQKRRARWLQIETGVRRTRRGFAGIRSTMTALQRHRP